MLSNFSIFAIHREVRTWKNIVTFNNDLRENIAYILTFTPLLNLVPNFKSLVTLFQNLTRHSQFDT